MSNVALNDILTAAKAPKVEIIPPDLGDELEAARSAHEKVIKALGNGCAAAIEAGEALNRIKAVVSKGEFMDYVEGVCHIPGRTARWYMQLADDRGWQSF